MRPSTQTARVIFCLVLSVLCRAAQAQSAPRITAPILPSERSVLSGSVPAKLKRATDQGAIQPGQVIDHMMLMLRPSAGQQEALDRLLKEQQDTTSPNYHHWLSPEEYAERFGVGAADLEVLTSWLTQQGFTRIQVSRTHRFLSFTGSATATNQAFGTELHRVILDGRSHVSNISAPTVPSALAGLVGAIVGLDNFPATSFHRPTGAAPRPALQAALTQNDFTPAAFAGVYDLGPLQQLKIDGTGVTIVVVGQADPDFADLSQFQSMFNLPQTSPLKILTPGSADPGTSSAADVQEAALDLEWVSAIAPGATVVFDYAVNAVTQAMVDAIDNNRGQIISVSFGDCEVNAIDNGELALTSQDKGITESVIQMGNAMGMTVLAASGDQGAAACELPRSTSARSGLAVNIPASIPEVTAVGGTEFTSTFSTASSYVAETAWDDFPQLGYLAASGGGESTVFPQPSWQAGIAPSGTNRYVPDVALSASELVEPYAIISGNALISSGGTSAATPSWAGILALVEQYLAQQGIQPIPGLGNANPLLYQLSQATPAPGTTIFHDIQTGGNTVGCQASSSDCSASLPYMLGFSAAKGYDAVTGLGSVDASQLAMWSGYTRGTPAISATPLGGNFLIQMSGTSSDPMTFTLSNTGTGLLSLTGISFVGTNTASFSETDTCGLPKRIFPGMSCAINVVFRPTVGGGQSALLLVNSNSAGPPISIALIGTGTAPIQNGSFPVPAPFTQATGYGGGPIIQAFDGLYYGVNSFGGVNTSQGVCPGSPSTVGGGCGTVFQLLPDGTYNVLYSFTGGKDGAFPSSLIQGPDGNLYGTTLQGGSTTRCPTGCGTLFKIAITGNTTPSIYAFGQSATDGQNPSSLTLGADGKIYGTTLGGGSNAAGTIFVFTPPGTSPSLLYSFQGGVAGSYPETLVQGSNSLFYGMTQESQTGDYGTVFQIDTLGNYRNLYTFLNHTDSANVKRSQSQPEIVKTQPSHSQNGGSPPNVYATPKALVQYSDGNFYGTTASPLADKRTVFQITPSGALTTLYTFTSVSPSSGDGGGSLYGLTLGSDGDFYGTSGDFIFRMTPGGRLFSLYQLPVDSYSGDPEPGSLLYASDGTLVDATAGYSQNQRIPGTSPAAFYCSSNCGYVFDYAPSPALAAPIQVSLSSTSGPIGTPVTLNWQTIQAYSLTSQQCYATLSGGAGGGIWTGKQTGTLTNGIYQGSTAIVPTLPGTYTYALTCGGTISASATFTAIKAVPIITLSASPSPAALRAPLTLTVKVSNPSGSGLVPTGTVLITNGYVVLASGALEDGVATIDTTAQDPDTPVGVAQTTVTFYAAYLGDDNFISPGSYRGSVSIKVQITSLQVTTGSLPSGTVGTFYSGSLNASGGAPPYQWALNSGSLPSGLALNVNTGLISGTPTSSGAVTFVAQVTDSKGVAATSPSGSFIPSLGITINDAPVATPSGPLTLLNYVPPTYAHGTTTDYVGLTYVGFFYTTGGLGQLTFRVTAGNLPDGLSLSSTGSNGGNTGILSGTPTTPGTFSFTVTITDSETPAMTVSTSITVNIYPAALSIVGFPSLPPVPYYPIPGGSVGNFYSDTLVATGGVAPYTWSTSDGSLPAGLSLDPKTGVISGVPSQASIAPVSPNPPATFTVQVTDFFGVTANATLSLQVDDLLTITQSALPTGVVGSAYSTALTASGGTGGDSWQLVSGNFPAGISLAPGTGTLSGTPTQSGSFPFIVLVSDSELLPASSFLAFTLNVNGAFTITSPPVLPAATASIPYSTALGTSGGVPGYRWSVASGALPGGLQLNPNTGVVSGTPNQAGTFTFAAQVTDSEVTPVSVSKIFCIGVPTTCALRFVPTTPCRVVDTRRSAGALGGPELAALSTREFDIPQSPCGIPASAAAYSLNVTVKPDQVLQYLTLWPSGTAQPNASTLNSYDGRVKANAAFVPSGANGGVNVFVTDATQVILDIDGYFVLEDSNPGLAFYAIAPCRVADTRGAPGPLAGPTISGQTSRSFPVQSSPCGIPSNAQAYSLNVTAKPKSVLSYLTTWPTGQPQPDVSTLNAPTGAVTANAAIIPGGSNGAVSIFVSDDSDVILDINGYFASGPFSAGALSLYTVAPCRVLDTRGSVGAFTGVLPPIAVATSPCAPSATAQAYVLNATVIPAGPLNYLTLWPDGEGQPDASTLNAGDAAITSNMAIVPTIDGKLDAFSLTSGSTQLILDITSYFAP